MSEATPDHAERDERRVYHACLACYVALLPVAVGLAVSATAGALGGHEARSLALANPSTIAFALVYGGLFLLAAWLLGRRQRAGGVLGLVLFTLMLLGNVHGGGVSLFSIVFALAGIVVIGRAWPALNPAPRLAA